MIERCLVIHILEGPLTQRVEGPITPKGPLCVVDEPFNDEGPLYCVIKKLRSHQTTRRSESG